MLKAAWKSLLGRKVRLLMSTFAIVLGVSFVVGTLIFSNTLDRSFTSIFASTVGDVVVRPVGGATANGEPSTITIPASVAGKLEKVDGAARVDGNVTSVAVYVVGKDGKVVSGGGAPAFGGNYTDAPAGHGITGLRIVAGDPPEGKDQVVLDRDTADKAGYFIGEKITLVTSNDPPVLRPRLVGLADFGEGGSLNGATLAMFDTRTAQDLFLGGKDAFSDIWVSAEPGVSQDELRDRVAKVLPMGFEAVTGDKAADENASDLKDAISFITTFLLVFAGISLVVGAFLIVNTFSILVAQRSRELALLRALGASRGQVLRSVLFEALILGILGSTIGAALGVGLAWVIEQVFGHFGLDLSGTPMVFRTTAFVAAYSVGVVVTVLAALFPAWRSARIPPVAALRDDIAMPQSTLTRRMLGGAVLSLAGGAALYVGLVSDVSGWFVTAGVLGILIGVAAMSPVISKPFLHAARVLYAFAFGSVGNLAGQNSLRNPRRTTATASALMIGLTLCCTMAIAGSSAKASVDKTVRENFVGDFVVSNVFGMGFSPSVADQMEKTDGVASVSRMRFALAKEKQETIGLLGVDPATVEKTLNVKMTEGSLADLAAGSVIVSEKRAQDNGLAVGDQVKLKVPAGARTLEVSGIYTDNVLLGGGYVTTLKELQVDGFKVADNYVYIVADPGADLRKLQDRLDALTKDLPMVSVKDQAGLVEEQRATIDQLLLLIYGLLALSLVIAVMGIVNTLGLSVIERTREVGLLRAIGVSRTQLWRMITLESVVISLLGAILGVVLGLGFGIALMYDLRSQGLEVIAIPWGQLTAFLVTAMVVGVLAAVLPSIRAARLNVLRAIATE
jgi:putative ABC transport system permease protein